MAILLTESETIEGQECNQLAIESFVLENNDGQERLSLEVSLYPAFVDEQGKLIHIINTEDGRHINIVDVRQYIKDELTRGNDQPYRAWSEVEIMFKEILQKQGDL